MRSKHYQHGGNLDHIANTYGIERTEIIDFSGNINPLGISDLAKEAIISNTGYISTYPDRNYVRLREVLGEYCEAAKNNILVANGVSELISLAISTLKPKKAITFAPTYSEYEREIGMIGGVLDYYTLEEKNGFKVDTNKFLEKLKEGYELLIICNPNNPTSTAFTKEELAQIIEVCRSQGIFVVIDETYIEFCDDQKVFGAIPLVPYYENLLVLRGVSKFFSAPGLRFGYGITANESFRKRLAEAQNPWSVNSLAEVAVMAMMQDEEYIQSTHKLFVEERRRVLGELMQIKNLHVYKPEANFVLLKIINKDIKGYEVMNKLLEEKLLIRDASSFPSLDTSYIRFCFLDRESNDRLLKHLKEILR